MLLSVQDILENDDIQLDSMFFASLVHDIVRVSTFCVDSHDFHINLFSDSE